MNKNTLMIAAAGAGKTTYLVNEALKQSGEILITTYTEANEEEIKRKIIKIHKFIPANITVQTWFSFLMQHGVKPYQGSLSAEKINGLFFITTQSGSYLGRGGKKYYYSESNQFEWYYFSTGRKLYSDKLSKFVVRCNENSSGKVIDRVSRIYSHIYVDEVQDLAGYDLEVLKLFFQSNSIVLLVGDPRQVTYLTHHDKRFSQYKEGKIEEFIVNECVGLDCKIDKQTLKYSHRNNSEICSFSSKLYPHYPASEPCSCTGCRPLVSQHNGIYLVKKDEVKAYIEDFQPTILRYSMSGDTEWNFGEAKGLGFERVLIYPPATFLNYLRNGSLTKTEKGKTKNAFAISKLYVAITRAVYSAGIVYDYKDNDAFIEGVNKYMTANI